MTRNVKIRFRTVKQVKDALNRNRNRIANGFCATLHAEHADGAGSTRLYYLYNREYGPLTLQHVKVFGHIWTLKNAFADISNWIQGGLDKEGLLAWANENLD